MERVTHRYFWGSWPPMPWKENTMLDAATEKRIKAIEERLDGIESALSALLEEQEDAEDAKKKKRAAKKQKESPSPEA